MSPPASPGRWAWLGRVPFHEAAALQEEMRRLTIEGDAPETLLLCEHEPVITLGRHARSEHVLLSERALQERGIELVRATRGGDVTYHGPGQLVGYPIFEVRRGIVHHVESMARAIVATLSQLGIVAAWRRAVPGVWVAEEKICAFGVHVSRRVSIHGFALNVAPALDGFEAIIPCGLRDAAVTSIERLKGTAPPVDVLARQVVRAFEEAFDRSFAEEKNPLPGIAKPNFALIE